MLILFATFVAACSAYEFSNERLNYVISYKWGLIHKDAGTASLTLQRSGSHYNVMLDARTKPWADKFYRVRDTLMATMRTVDLRPISYTKITHEKDQNDRDEVKYTTFKTVTRGDVTRYRNRNGKETVTRNKLTASGPVFDMLSVFYYLRSLDYDKLKHRNQVYKATVFSGSKSETITIRSLGRQKIKLKDKTTREAIRIRFNFTQHGGTKSSEDIDCWISTDAAHIPLYVVGKLPIGEVRAYYTGSTRM